MERGLQGWVGTLVAILVAIVGMGGVEVLSGTPSTVVLAAALPVLAWAAVLVRATRRVDVPAAVAAATFLWGAVVATALATGANDLAQSTLATYVGEASARALVPTLVGPLIEETAKDAVLVLILVVGPHALRGVGDGIVLGALTGLGFTLVENVRYVMLAVLGDGMPGLWRAVWLRGIVEGFNHAAFTATAGAALGAVRAGARRVVAVLGLVAAVGLHALWNGVASEWMTEALCSPLVPDGPCRPAPGPWTLFVTAPLVVVIFLMPGVVFLGLMAMIRTPLRAPGDSTAKPIALPPVRADDGGRLPR